MKRQRTTAPLSLAIVACIFLFNPIVTVFDILPDFIGYVLLCLAFSRWADLNETVGRALAGFRRMILVDLGKYLAILWIFGMAAQAERNSSVLLWTFVFSVLELVFALPSFLALFDGITEIGYFYPNTAILSARTKRNGKPKRSSTERMRRATAGFLIVRAVLTAAPEFAELTSASYDETGNVIDLYRYIGLLRVASLIPVLIVGIVWLCRACCYFGRLRKDRALADALDERYASTVACKTGLFAGRYLRYASVILTVALVLTLDFRMEGQNLLPDCLAAIAFFVCFIFLRKINKERSRHAEVALSVSYFSIALVAAVLESRFAEEFTLGMIYKSLEAMHLYNLVILANLAKLALFVGTLCLILSHLREVVACHTGFVVGRERIGENEQKMVKALHGELRARLRAVLIAVLAYAVSDLLYDLLIAELAWFAILPTVVGLIAIAFAIRATSAIADAVQTKYMLE